MEIRVGPTFSDGADKVIPAVYQKLKAIKDTGRTEYAWPDASSITLEVSYRGKVLKATCNPKLLSQSLNSKNKAFHQNWTEAHKLLWNLVREEAGG